MVEFWRSDAIERSWRVLESLRSLVDFVIIGGWGVYLWSKRLKSRDVDICIEDSEFYKLQANLLNSGVKVKRNPRLKNFETVINGVEVDVYTSFMCNLVIPCSDIFSQRMYTRIEGFKVALPEVLLILKCQAAKKRWFSEKGMKDRIDVISLFAFVDVRFDILAELLARYDEKGNIRSVLRRILRESRKEYRFLNLSYERDGVRLLNELKRYIP